MAVAKAAGRTGSPGRISVMTTCCARKHPRPERRQNTVLQITLTLLPSSTAYRVTVGPLIVDEILGVPYTAEAYRAWFRRIARKAGIPDTVWSMDARAGAITEAWESGAEPAAVMAMATHTQLSTSRRYNRSNVEQISRAARLRIKSRKDDGNG
jgi:hypothetical protein